MGRVLDVTVVVPPPLRALFEGRREVSLGMPATAGVGEVFETLLSLYPRMRLCFAGDRPVAGGPYLHFFLDEHALADLAAGGPGLSPGRRVVLSCLSRPSPSRRPGA